MVTVKSKEELLKELDKKSDYICIESSFAEEILKLMKNHMTEKELMGFELGSRGSITTLAYIIDFLREKISKDEIARIDRKLKIYKIDRINEGNIILKLKQLDY